jgi:membrane protein YdbS with pleckstrin-like domain
MTQIQNPATPAPDNRPHRPADDTEEVYFEGSPLLRAEMGKVIIWGLIGIVLIAIPVANWVYFKDAWPWWLSLALIVIGIGLFFVPLGMRKTLKYRITNYRIDVTTGVLSRNIETLELWHVEEPRLHQSFLNRMVDVGSITILSHDATLPTLTLYGLPKPQELFRIIEQRVIAVKRQRGVMKVDPG